MQRKRRSTLGLVAASTLFVACGGGSGEDSGAADPTSTGTESSAATVTTVPAADVTSAEITTGPTGPTATSGPSSGGTPSMTFESGEGNTTPAVTSDGPTVPTAAPTDALAVRPESADSPLPEVVVRHVQTGDLVQLKNLLPAAKPLLVWFWAPH